MKKFLVVVIGVLLLLMSAITIIESSADEVEVEYTKMYTSYKIEGGDTLSEICHEWYYSDEYLNHVEWDDYKSMMHEVEDINSIKVSDRLYAGNYIIIPYCVIK